MAQRNTTSPRKRARKAKRKRRDPGRKMPAGMLATSGVQLILPRLDKRAESTEARISREVRARHTSIFILGKLFVWLKVNIGVEDAWRDFDEWVQLIKPKTISNRRGPSDHQADIRLLQEYDRLKDTAPENLGSLPRLLAEKLHKNGQGEFGASPEAIAKRVRRLLERRKARRAIDAEVGAALEGLVRELGWGAKGARGKRRRPSNAKKSKDK